MRPSRPPMRFPAAATSAPAGVPPPSIPAGASASPPSSSSSPSFVISEVDRAAQAEELEVLKAIYDADLTIVEQKPVAAASGDVPCHTCFRVRLADDLTCEVRLPPTYPSVGRPTFVLHLASPDGASPSYSDVLSAVADAIPTVGEAIVFQCLDLIRERVGEAEQARRAALAAEEEQARIRRDQEEHAALLAIEAAVERDQRVSAFDEEESDATAAAASSSSVACPRILTGPPLTDRKSTFVAHVASVHTVADTRAVLSVLYANTRIARATHNMYAYVLKDSGGIVRRENEDDGEDLAGSRLAHLLQMMSAENLMVVVTRWYGGVQLGPDRFKHINNVARAAIEAHWKENNANNALAAAAGAGTAKAKKVGSTHATKR